MASVQRSKLLDQLRGLAILAVLLRHAWPELLPQAGVVGVVTFFTLSGYLITGLLVDEIKSTTRLNLRWFYAKRAIRLLPALIAFLLVWITTSIIGGTELSLVFKSTLIAVAYVANLPLGIEPSLGHLWTLSTEEQFYLLWPLILVAATAAKKVGLIIGSLAAASVALLLTSAKLAPGIEAIYFLPTSWALCLLVGGAAAVYKVRLKFLKSRSKNSILFLFLAVFVCCWMIPVAKSDLAMYLLVGPGVALLTAALLVWAENSGVRSLDVPGLLPLGTVSYAAYLWNYPIAKLSLELFGDVIGPLIGIFSSVAVAAASWFLVEKPANKLRQTLSRRFQNRRAPTLET